MAFKAALGVITLALLWPFIYDRSHMVSLFWKNAPNRLVKINTFASHEIRFADRIRSCEDAIMVESKGVAILGCDPGRERWNTVMGLSLPGPVENAGLYVFDYKDKNMPDDEALKKLTFINFKFQSQFHTLGMAYNESTSTLFVTSHRQDYPAIEVFKLDLETYTATHLRSIQHHLIHAPNSIVLANENELYVTNDHHFLIRDWPFFSMIETYAALPGGSVVHVDMSPLLEDPGAAVRATVLARIPFANGIELLNETTAVVVSTSESKLHFYAIDKPADNDGAPKFKHISEVRVTVSPDNLSLSKDGALMISGHPHAPALAKFAKTRHICNAPDELAKADAQMRETCQTLTSPSYAARWTKDGGVEILYVGTDYPSSATAARDSDRKVGIIAGLYAKGILVWRE
ncbi:putative paraoxonase [Xylaria intraflava]|nr:putative paraoxonase [Xylaria intraflava]